MKTYLETKRLMARRTIILAIVLAVTFMALMSFVVLVAFLFSA